MTNFQSRLIGSVAPATATTKEAMAKRLLQSPAARAVAALPMRATVAALGGLYTGPACKAVAKNRRWRLKTAAVVLGPLCFVVAAAFAFMKM